MVSDALRMTEEGDPDGGVRVTNMELFFDLDSVFAITSSPISGWPLAQRRGAAG